MPLMLADKLAALPGVLVVMVLVEARASFNLAVPTRGVAAGFTPKRLVGFWRDLTPSLGTSRPAVQTTALRTRVRKLSLSQEEW